MAITNTKGRYGHGHDVTHLPVMPAETDPEEILADERDALLDLFHEEDPSDYSGREQ